MTLTQPFKLVEPAMLTRTLAILSVLALAACGVDGAPSSSRTSGVTFTGDASLGVVVNPNQLEGRP
jgi:hypothetical protein